MTTEYTRNVLKVVVAQICQTIGWHSVNSTPLEYMVDLLQEYIFQLSKLTQQYSQVLGRSEANLDDLGLSFWQMNIDLNELAEYIKNVESVPCAISVPKLPIARENHLNFLKPGSREVVTRPVHVHEYLPAMFPGSEEEYESELKKTENENAATTSEQVDVSEDNTNEINSVNIVNGLENEDSPSKLSSQSVFKRPGDPVSIDGSLAKKAKIVDEGRPLREIHSVIMTTSGYLSTAREGKLPEARTPLQSRAETPPPLSPSPPPPPTEISTEVKSEKKIKKINKKNAGLDDGKPENKENKKKKIPKDTLFQPDEIKEVKVKKLAGMKELAKLKALKSGSKMGNPSIAGPSNITGKIQGKVPGSSPKAIKNAKIKTGKIVDGVQNVGYPLSNEVKEEAIDKLPIEPDKQKLNIFKKISSKSKEDKEKELLDPHYRSKEFASRENSPGILVDDNERYRNDFVAKQDDKKSIQNAVFNNNTSRLPGVVDSITDIVSPGSDLYMSDDMSMTGTPRTPKTPEFSFPILPPEQVKKSKKDKTGKKKEAKLKGLKNTISTKKVRLSSDSAEIINLDRPRTPQAPEHAIPRDSNLSSLPPFNFFPPMPVAPGLIPYPIQFPVPMSKNMVPGMAGPPNPAGVMPNMMRQRLFRPKIDPMKPLVPPSFMNEPFQAQQAAFPFKQQPLEKSKPLSNVDNESFPPKLMATSSLPQEIMPHTMNMAAVVPAPLIPPPISPAAVPAPLLPPTLTVANPTKSEKSEKKSKEHKKEKKEKMKKKKEKKDKHKEKGEKIKEKKDKSEKKDKLEKLKEKKEKKEKRKEKEALKKLKEEKAIEGVPKITLKIAPAESSPRPPSPDSALMKRITIKPPKKPEDESNREPTPELAKISALVTRPPKIKSTKTKVDAVPKTEGIKEENSGNLITKPTVTVDQNGRQIWICPACGKQDDGSPMIGCDDCDDWYHWVCVGIQIAPAAKEDWFCRSCIAKKQEQYHDKKKKKRKKKIKITD